MILDNFLKLIHVWNCKLIIKLIYYKVGHRYYQLGKLHLIQCLKMSPSGVFLVRIFPHLDWIWRDSLHNQSECRKIQTRKTPNTEIFHAVITKQDKTLLCNSIKSLRMCRVQFSFTFLKFLSKLYYQTNLTSNVLKMLLFRAILVVSRNLNQSNPVISMSGKLCIS